MSPWRLWVVISFTGSIKIVQILICESLCQKIEHFVLVKNESPGRVEENMGWVTGNTSIVRTVTAIKNI